MTPSNAKPRNKIIMTVGLLIAIFIPLYIAVIYYNVAKNAPPTASNVTQLVITDIKGNSFELNASEADAAEDIAWFVGINKRAIKQESAPKQLRDIESFNFEYRIFDRSQTYKYYFTDKLDEAYCVDANGTAYL